MDGHLDGNSHTNVELFNMQLCIPACMCCWRDPQNPRTTEDATWLKFEVLKGLFILHFYLEFNANFVFACKFTLHFSFKIILLLSFENKHIIARADN